MKKPFKIVFLGTPDFAVPSLERLYSDGHKVLCSITQPDRKRGRGGKVSFSPVKEKSLELGINIFQPERIKRNESVEYIRSLEPELLVTCAYGQILPGKLLDIPAFGCINVHASLLPLYRGAAPIQRCILNGDEKTGITTMMTDVGMDTGDILLKKEISLPYDITAGELHDRLMFLGADAISETIEKLASENLPRKKQADEYATYAPMLRKEESVIDWTKDSFSIHNKVRAFDPWPGCFTQFKGKRVRITKSMFSKEVTGKKPGTILETDKEAISTACGQGVLKILGIQFENGKRMDVSMCWHNFSVGELFGKGN